MDYSRARVKPGMCRDYPRAVLVQIAPTPSRPVPKLGPFEMGLITID